MKTFLPQDARFIDIVSALSLLGFALQISVFGYVGHEFLDVRDVSFWVMSLSTMGVLQLASVYLHPHAETLRSIVAGISGLFWVYLFLNTCTSVGFSPITLFTGVGCLYSSVITALYIGQTWKS